MPLVDFILCRHLIALGNVLGAGEMTQRLRALAVLAEYPGSNPVPTWGLTAIYSSSSSGPPLSSRGTA